MEFLQEELDEILNIFAQEGAEILQSMDKNLLLLEKKPDDIDIAMHLFRDAHSLKGSARMLGFNGIQNIAHKIEDVLGLIREGKLKVNSNITDTISNALSLIDKLIKKTVEQKSEFISDENEIHIKKLDQIANREQETENPAQNKTTTQNEIENSLFEKNFAKFEDLIVSIIFIYTKCIQYNDYEQLQDIIAQAGELSRLSEEIKEKELTDISLNISDITTRAVREAKETDSNEILYELNLKINEFIQKFNSLAAKNGLETKNYYENAYKLSSNNILAQTDEAQDKTSELKNAELLELINKATETITDINKNRHSLAEAKSLLNEIVSRLQNDDFKKIYQTILSIVLNFEKSSEKLESDGIEALKEILESTAGIVEARGSKNVYNDFLEEIDLLNQKAVIIAQMIKYEIENPAKMQRAQKTIKAVDWAQSFDSTAIKTLRVNSDKLDKLVQQIGNLIITRIKSHEHMGMVKTIQDELIEWQKHYHKIGYYMKFFEKKYIQEALTNGGAGENGKKDSFFGYNKQLIAFHNSNNEQINVILNNLNLLMKELQIQTLIRMK